MDGFLGVVCFEEQELRDNGRRNCVINLAIETHYPLLRALGVIDEPSGENFTECYLE